MRVFEDFLCAEETFAICEHEMCVDAVVDANMFVFDRDVYVYIKRAILCAEFYARWNEWERGKGFGFFALFFDPNTWPFLTTFYPTKSCLLLLLLLRTFNERNDERDDDSDDDDACERKF